MRALLRPPPGQPYAELRSHMVRNRQAMPLPTGDAVTASSVLWNATVIGPVGTNTKGSWAEIVSSTPNDIYGLMVFNTTATRISANDSSSLMDIGVGASGSEVVKVPNLAMGWRLNLYLEYRIPLFIPAGSRIAARMQSFPGSTNFGIYVVPLQRTLTGTRPSDTVVDLGTSTATSKGVTLSAAGSTNTKTAWTEIVSATTEPYRALMVGLQGGADTTQANATSLVDIGFGASGSEVAMIQNLIAVSSTNESIDPIDQGAWLIGVPAGTRISARYQTTNTGTSLDVIVYGIR